MLKGSSEIGPATPASEVDSLLRAQRDLMDELSHAVIRTRNSFAKALAPERNGKDGACSSAPVPECAPLVDALMNGNALLSSILNDLHSINDRSVL
ncbi:TPA: hypothetical protein ACGCGJ_000404 [Stenotrophomonas maltophilia]|uniref:hypothetical protein n=1 Tax=Stenotrophomonas maltophilia TaxID=40324 RepID=UPI000DA972BD|nr:hypothetical protein [Stenotrophomonas maltophilia]PZS96330.1 hypothetical protein A7X66_09185 [Stenotrophomonas maltophilia]